MRAIMDAVLKRFVVIGTLRVRWPDGLVSVYAGTPAPDVTLAMQDWATIRRIVINPSMAVGEGYMDGGLQPIGCTIYDVLDLLMANMGAEGSTHLVMSVQNVWQRIIRRLAQ